MSATCSESQEKSKSDSLTLKPCPFCGTIPKVIKRNVKLWPYAIDHGDGPLDYQCPLDYLLLVDYSSEEKAISHWNRRWPE